MVDYDSIYTISTINMIIVYAIIVYRSSITMVWYMIYCMYIIQQHYDINSILLYTINNNTSINSILYHHIAETFSYL